MNEFIRVWRKRFGLSQREFADKTGFSQKMISFWESAKATPEDSSLRRIAEALGIEYQDFLLGPEEYDKRRREREIGQSQVISLDPKRISLIYLLSRLISPNLDDIRGIGYSLIYQLEPDPQRYFLVVTDEGNEIVPRGRVIGIRKLKPGEQIKPDQIVLVYDQTAYFIQWQTNSSPTDFLYVYGVGVDFF